jgi:hypothetical protein
MSHGAPQAERVQRGEVDDESAVGTVDLDVSGGGVVLVVSAEEVDEGTDHVGDPVAGAGHVPR